MVFLFIKCAKIDSVMNHTKKLLVEPKSKAIAPNIALMKFARWCDLQGHEYQYVRGMVYPKIKPDEILISCIFSYHSKLYEETINHYLRLFPDAKVTVGGVFPSLLPEWFQKWDGAVTVHQGLCPEIEYIAPKYDVNIQSSLPTNSSIFRTICPKYQRSKDWFHCHRFITASQNKIKELFYHNHNWD